MYGTNTAPVQCFLATPSEVRNVPVEAKSLDESSLQLCKGEGAYTVIPIYPGAKVANRYSLHFNRLIESSNILQIPTKSFSQPDIIWDKLRECWNLSNLHSARARITFDEFFMEENETGSILIALEPWIPFSRESDIYSKGVKVQTLPNTTSRKFPRAKHNGWIHERYKMTHEGGIYEHLLLDAENRVLESSGSNFIGVRDENTLVVPFDSILIGLARQIFIDAVKNSNFTVVCEPPSLAEVLEMKEAFLCSASRGVFPIVEIDKKPVGEGVPGPIFQILDNLYRTQLASEMVPL